jgi:hypothetical protein
MSGVFRNIDSPPLSPPGECVLPPPPLVPMVRGEDTLAGWRGGGGSIIVRKTPDTALYSIYVSRVLCGVEAFFKFVSLLIITFYS